MKQIQKRVQGFQVLYEMVAMNLRIYVDHLIDHR